MESDKVIDCGFAVRHVPDELPADEAASGQHDDANTGMIEFGPIIDGVFLPLIVQKAGQVRARLDQEKAAQGVTDQPAEPAPAEGGAQVAGGQ